MSPEFGHFALALAFAVAVVQGPLLLIGAGRAGGGLAVTGARAAVIILALVALSFACLMTAYAASDFSVLNVYQNSHTAKPFLFKLSGTWGNHEGSMLLWALVLAGYSGALARTRSALPGDLFERALGIQFLIIAAFLAFILFTSNPFERLTPIPQDGAGLNPLLQDVGLAVHPPFLYLGYVGFSAPFSLAVAALLRGEVDSLWAGFVRPWALAAWSFMTIGIMLGAWWAYYELGWGGWWAWDPVENASFMPWLAGTALIHSIRVLEVRNALKAWAVLLAIATFSLSLVGTFLVRSGVLTSVHAFATDPERGVFILAILAVVVGGSLTLYAMRAGRFAYAEPFAPVSREGFLVINNLLITVACATVFVGTFYPLFVDVLTGSPISVGAPYFNTVFTPIAVATLLFAGLGVLAPWKQAAIDTLCRRALPVIAAASVGGLTAAAIAETRLATALGAGAVVVWLAGGAITDIGGRLGLRGRGHLARAGARGIRRAARLPRAAWGAAIAHLGLALFALGAFAVSLWKVEDAQLLTVGQEVEFAGSAVTLQEVTTMEGDNYTGERAHFTVRRAARRYTLYAERRYYPVRRMQTTEAAIRSLGIGDLYLTVGENAGGRGWPVRFSFHPLVGCLWWGAAVTALGGFVSLSGGGLRARRQMARTPRPKLDPAPQAGGA